MAHKEVIDTLEQHEGSRLAVFQAVAARQLHYNDMTWQVPVLSLTAQAFLFSIALDSSSTRFARLTSSGLALISALASMQLMARHRNGDIHNSHWLADQERALGDNWVVHGRAFVKSRNKISGGGPLARFGVSFVWWMIVLCLFGLAAALTICIEFVRPDLLIPSS